MCLFCSFDTSAWVDCMKILVQFSHISPRCLSATQGSCVHRGYSTQKIQGVLKRRKKISNINSSTAWKKDQSAACPIFYLSMIRAAFRGPETVLFSFVAWKILHLVFLSRMYKKLVLLDKDRGLGFISWWWGEGALVLQNVIECKHDLSIRTNLKYFQFCPLSCSWKMVPYNSNNCIPSGHPFIVFQLNYFSE